MLDSLLWPCFAVLLAVLFLPGGVITAVVVVGLVVCAGVFVVRVAALVRRHPEDGTGLRLVRPAGASETPTTPASAGLSRGRDAA